MGLEKSSVLSPSHATPWQMGTGASLQQSQMSLGQQPLVACCSKLFKGQGEVLVSIKALGSLSFQLSSGVQNVFAAETRRAHSSQSSF